MVLLGWRNRQSLLESEQRKASWAEGMERWGQLPAGKGNNSRPVGEDLALLIPDCRQHGC